MSLMTYLQPYITYMISAIILCVLYIGIEKSHGKMGFSVKCIICSWCIISTIVISALFGVQQQLSNLRPVAPPVLIGTFAASLITLSISSCCVYCAA